MTDLLKDLEAVALLPCPFCGGEAALTRGKDLQYGDFIREQWVACCKGERDADCFGEREPSYFAADLAIAAWNTRTHHAEIAEAVSLSRKAERMEDALYQIKTWSEAYPLSVFPEPDWKRAAEVLEAAGMTLDRISAANMRHVIERVQQIADAAIDAQHNSAREG